MKKTILLSIAALLAASCVSCANQPGGSIFPRTSEIISDSVIEKTFDFNDFNELSIGSAFSVELTKSDQYSVKVEIPEVFEDYLVVKVERGELSIYFKQYPHKLTTIGSLKFKAYISMPEIVALDLSGASKLQSYDTFVCDGKFDLDLSGASHLKPFYISGRSLDIDVSGASKAEVEGVWERVTVDVSGASRVNIAGAADSFDVDCSGASTCDAEKLEAHGASVECSGASTATVFALETLKVELSGASTCRYKAGENMRMGSTEVDRACSLKEIR